MQNHGDTFFYLIKAGKVLYDDADERPERIPHENIESARLPISDRYIDFITAQEGHFRRYWLVRGTRWCCIIRGANGNGLLGPYSVERFKGDPEAMAHDLIEAKLSY